MLRAAGLLGRWAVKGRTDDLLRTCIFQLVSALVKKENELQWRLPLGVHI